MPIHQFPDQLYTNFSVIFQRMSAELAWYIGSTSCMNHVNFQVRMPKVKVTQRHNRKCGNLQMARCSLDNSSIHPTYFLPFFQPYILSSNTTKSQDTCIPCPRTFLPRTRLMNLGRAQFSLKADLPVEFPYKFNSSFKNLSVQTSSLI